MTRKWVSEGKLAVVGITQEQHAERCRLFMQWKELDWPILHDPINVLQSTAVPIALALDEHGIVRSTRPSFETFEKDFLAQSFPDDATSRPALLTPAYPPDVEQLRVEAERAETALAWRRFGDALALWGDAHQVSTAIAAYTAATKADPDDGAAWFRLGVCLRRRSETSAGEPNDFRAAVEAWSKALDLDPNQYIWRRRLQQYGPRLDKPYPFYDWVDEAMSTIRKRGDTPIALTVPLLGAEMSHPAEEFLSSIGAPQNPDPAGKVTRDEGAVRCDVVVVPATVRAGHSARVHLTFRLATSSLDHWNNEADPLRVWLEPPEGIKVSERLIEATNPPSVVSTENRMVGFEVQIPNDASGTIRLPAYALYHVCDAVQGHCRFLRLDVNIMLNVK